MRRVVVLCLMAVLLASLPSARQVAAAGDTPGPEWVAAGRISGGCSTSGSCDGQTSPPLEGWFEYLPDRTYVGPDQPPVGAPSSLGSVSPAREQCWYDAGGSRYVLQWAAGSWHHAAYWSRVNGRWYGPQSWNWGFLHGDTCEKNIPPTAVPTATGVPTATVAPVPGSVTIAVLACGDRALATTITAFAGGWSQSQIAASVTFSVPPSATSAGYVVDVPPGWSVASGAASGTVRVGGSVTVGLTGASCSAGPTPGPGQPTPTPPPALCAGSGPYSGFRIPLAVSGAGAAVTPRLYAEHAGGRYTAPVPDPAQGTVSPGQPLSVSFDLTGLSAQFATNHDGQAQIRLGLLDRTSGQVLLSTDTTDVKELRDADGRVIVWGRSLQLSQVTLAPGVSFPGAAVWRQWAAWRAGGGWINPTGAPQLNRFYYALQPVTLSFVPQAGHVYEAWAMAAQGACQLDFWRWSRAVFGAGPQLTPTLPPACPGGSCPTPTPLPTPTPPPPPPVPQAQIATRLALHSRYDPDSSWGGTPRGSASPDDAVHLSRDLHIAWPAGEPLDWTPRVELLPIPDAVISDPWYGPIRYSYSQQVVAWTYLGSTGQPAVSDGCPGGTSATSAEGGGCRYPYLPDGQLSEAALHAQPHVLWLLRPLASPGDPSLYRYALAAGQAVDLQLAVLVSVTQLRDGQPVASELRVVPLSARVDLAVPRSVR